MTDVLNPDLYKRLQQRFGAVKIHNPGEAMQGSWLSNFGQNRFQVTHWGEVYGVNCFACTDSRQRLAINHRWGVGPPTGNDKNKFWNMAVCYNENCHERAGFHDELRKQLYGLYKPPDLSVKAGKKVEFAQNAELPGLVVRVDELPMDHPANKYLLDRKFNSYKLAELYGVGYCYSSDNFPMAVGRLIAPFYMNKELVGWQGRYVGELDNWKTVPKYYTMPGAWPNHVLYDYDTARAVSPDLVLVTEGIFDCWRLGPGSVALLGKLLKGTQGTLLGQWKKVVLILDSDAQKEGKRIKEQLRGKSDVALVTLPAGEDPATMEGIWDVIIEQCEMQGMELG